MIFHFSKWKCFILCKNRIHNIYLFSIQIFHRWRQITDVSESLKRQEVILRRWLDRRRSVLVLLIDLQHVQAVASRRRRSSMMMMKTRRCWITTHDRHWITTYAWSAGSATFGFIPWSRSNWTICRQRAWVPWNAGRVSAWDYSPLQHFDNICNRKLFQKSLHLMILVRCQ